MQLLLDPARSAAPIRESSLAAPRRRLPRQRAATSSRCCGCRRSCRCVIAERNAEVALLKHMVDKLKLQLARRAREQYGRCSEQLVAQLMLLACEAPKTSQASTAQPAPTKPRRDQRKLPEHRSNFKLSILVSQAQMFSMDVR